MKKIIALLLFVSPVIAMEKPLDIQKKLLELKKEKLKLKKREVHIQELKFLAKYGNAHLHQDPELDLFYQNSMGVAITDIFFEKFKQLSEDQKQRINKLNTTTKEALAKERGVSIENIFDPEVVESTQRKEFLDLMKKSEQDVQAILQL